MMLLAFMFLVLSFANFVVDASCSATKRKELVRENDSLKMELQYKNDICSSYSDIMWELNQKFPDDINHVKSLNAYDALEESVNGDFEDLVFLYKIQ